MHDSIDLFYIKFSSFMFPLIGGMLTSFYSLPLSALIIAEFLLTEVQTIINKGPVSRYYYANLLFTMPCKNQCIPL